MLPPLPSHCPRCTTPLTTSAPFCPECELDLRHESPVRVKSSLCTYCSVDGPNLRQKITKEHIFGKWLKREFPQRATSTRATHNRPETDEIDNQEIHTRVELQRVAPYDLQVPHVCEECNGGWMSTLQTEAKPILMRLVTGTWPDLTDEECRVIARWCVMVAINIGKHKNMGIFDPSRLRALKYGEMPEGYIVTAVRVACPDGRMAGYHHYNPMESPIGFIRDRTSIISTLFCIEQTAFMVTEHEGPRALYDVIKKHSGDLGRFPREIYPTNSPATESANIWLTNETLLAYDIAWAAKPGIPVIFYGSRPLYRIRSRQLIFMG